MIDKTTWRKYISFALTTLLCVGALAACTSESPTGPTGPGDGDPVDPPGDTGTVTLIWDAPTSDADGSGPITDLVGYTICFGSSRSQLNSCNRIGNVTQYELELPAGTYYFAVRAVDTWGNESDFSNTLQVTVEVPGASVVDEAAVIASAPAPDSEQKSDPTRVDVMVVQ